MRIARVRPLHQLAVTLFNTAPDSIILTLYQKKEYDVEFSLTYSSRVTVTLKEFSNDTILKMLRKKDPARTVEMLVKNLYLCQCLW